MLLHELIYQLLPPTVLTPVGIFTCFLIYYFLCFLKNSLISSFNSDWLLTRSVAKHDIGYLFFSFLPSSYWSIGVHHLARVPVTNSKQNILPVLEFY